MLLRILIILLIFISSLYAEDLENCKWDNREGVMFNNKQNLIPHLITTTM